MALMHFPPDVSADMVADSLRKNGYAIVDDLVSSSVMDQIQAEMGPYIEDTLFGKDEFVGVQTKRTGSMIARSPMARTLGTHPLALATAGKLLEKASTFQLHLTQVISVYPGSPAQKLHQDELAWDF